MTDSYSLLRHFLKLCDRVFVTLLHIGYFMVQVCMTVRSNYCFSSLLDMSSLLFLHMYSICGYLIQIYVMFSHVVCRIFGVYSEDPISPYL